MQQPFIYQMKVLAAFKGKRFQIKLTDGVAVFTMNNLPVNPLSKPFVCELAETFTEAYKGVDLGQRIEAIQWV